MMTARNDGEGQAQGRPGQEGQAKEVPLLIFDELAFGREDLFMGAETPQNCIVCNHPEDNHIARHTFTPPGTRVDASQFGRKRPDAPVIGDNASRRITASQGPSQGVTTMPFDPVLRQALIAKGILTVEDLDDAQRMIATLTNQIMGGGASGSRSMGRS